VTARVLGMPKATLSNWVRASEKGALQCADDKPVSAEQMELARLRAELARVKMERDILKKRRRTLQGNLCESWLGTSTRRRLTWSGAAISLASPRTNEGCTWLR